MVPVGTGRPDHGTLKLMTLKHGMTLALATLAAMTIVGCNKGGSDVATVNGEAISSQDYVDYLETKQSFTVNVIGLRTQNNVQQALQTLSQGGSANLTVPQLQTPGFQALRDLITRKVTMQLAKEEGWVSKKEDIDAEINFQKELEENFVKNLQRGRGMSMEAIRNQIEFELAQQYLIKKGITVTDKDVDDYIEANKETQFTEPAEADLQWIMVPTSQKAAVDAELAKGRRFKDVALEMSTDPNRQATGAKAPPSLRVLRTMPEPIRNAVNTAGVNGTTQWFDENGTSFKLYVVGLTKDNPIEITDARKKQVKRTLEIQRGNQAKDINKRILEAVLAAEVDVKNSNLKGMWEEYKKGAENALKQQNAAETILPAEGGATTPNDPNEAPATTGTTGQ